MPFSIKMPRRFRMFLGAVLMPLLVIVWALLAMALAQGRVREAAEGWQMLYYVVAGMGWIIPAGLLIRWMQRPDREE